jgi:tripartite-type tricarboxylate transporter receptor subunit TctC
VKPRPTDCLAAAAGALLACVMANATAQQFPSRPIRIIVPNPPGGGNDLLARQVAARLPERLGQQVVVDNRSGAGGNLGAEVVAKAPADGYTILIHSNSMAISAALYPRLNYNPTTDLAPLALLTNLPLVLVTHPSVPARNINDLVALSKKRKGGINYASSGSGSISHLAGVLLVDIAKIDLTHVPYKGSGVVFTALIGGEVDIAFPSVPSAIEYLRSGRLRALAVTSLNRSAALPDVPTVASSYRGYEAGAWYGFFLATGTPAPIVERLVSEIQQVHSSPDMRSAMQRTGLEPAWMGPAEFSKFYKEELTRCAKLVKLADIKPD